MTTPSHHPSDAVLADYASGSLRPAFATVCAAHVQTCAQCRSRTDLLETIGGQLLSELPPASMEEQSLSRAMARLERPARLSKGSAGPVADRIRFGRKRWGGPGVWLRQANRACVGSDLLYLLRVPAGMGTVPHGHHGVEYTAVLRGGFSDSHGSFDAGDFIEMSEQDDHPAQVAHEDECICLIASERPMRMQNWVGRLIQAMTGV